MHRPACPPASSAARRGGGGHRRYTAGECKRGVYVNIAWYIGYSLINTPFLFVQRFATRWAFRPPPRSLAAGLASSGGGREREGNDNLLFLRFYTTPYATSFPTARRVFRQDCAGTFGTLFEEHTVSSLHQPLVWILKKCRVVSWDKEECTTAARIDRVRIVRRAVVRQVIRRDSLDLFKAAERFCLCFRRVFMRRQRRGSGVFRWLY